MLDEHSNIWFVLICIVWIAIRLTGVGDAGNAEWEKNVALKLNEYGWQATNGGILNWHYVFGYIENPQNHLYVNHPPGMIWLYAIFIKLFGCEWIRLIPLTFNFIGLTSIYYLSRRYFNQRTAIYSALIVSFLPCTLFLDKSLNIIILSTVFWILVTILTLRWYESERRKDMLLVMTLIVAATQVDWVNFLLLPFIIIGIMMLVKKDYQKKYVYCMLLTFMMAGVIYLSEIIGYSMDYHDLFRYLSNQTVVGSIGMGQISFGVMQSKIITKLMLYTNPIAILLAAMGLYWVAVSKNKKQLYISLMFIGPFVIMIVVFNKFMYVEIAPFKLIAPFIAVAGGYGITRLMNTKISFYRPGIVVLTVMLLFVTTSVIINIALEERKALKSRVSLKIADELVRNTANGDIIFSNLQEKEFPFPCWEEGSWLFTSYYANRFLRFDIKSVDQILKFKDETRMNPTIYMYVPQAKNTNINFNSDAPKISFEKINVVKVDYHEEIKLSRMLSFLLMIADKWGLPATKVGMRNDKYDVYFNVVFYRIRNHEAVR